MSLLSRIGALERAFNTGPGEGQCWACGGPSPGMDSVAVADKSKPMEEHQGPDLALYLGRRCPECRLLVDEAGRSFPSASPSKVELRRGVKLIARQQGQ